jgi:hydroxyacylglutathione hydrolase
MIQIQALPAFTDNYLWLLQDPEHKRCAVVDPGDAAPVLAWLDAHPGWQLSDILVTHHHFDHIGGVDELKQRTGARVLASARGSKPERDLSLGQGDRVEVLGLTFEVIEVPGHTLDHIAYFHGRAVQPLLFCGDTLFAAGCGRLFEGTAQQMHESLQQLAALPSDTLVYCTHEYTLSNLRFAMAVEPENPQLVERLQQVESWRAEGRISLPSNIALERATNPFLRADQPSVTNKMSLPSDTATPSACEVFSRLRQWKDRF